MAGLQGARAASTNSNLELHKTFDYESTRQYLHSLAHFPCVLHGIGTYFRAEIRRHSYTQKRIFLPVVSVGLITIAIKALNVRSSMQSRQLIVFKLPAAVISALSLIQLAHLLKNVPDCNSFFSKLTRLLSVFASGAGMTSCFREKANDANTSAAALAHAYLAPAVLKRAVAQVGRTFRRLFGDALDVAADIGFVGLTVTRAP